MTEPWRIRLLGGLGAFRNGDHVTRFRTQKTGGLLAYLAFYVGRVHPREMLMEVLWPESELDAARNSLSVALNSLRRQLEPPATPGTASVGVVLIADRNTVRLNPDGFTTDVSVFETALEDAARIEAPDGILESLIQADQQYTGELLPGFYEDWVLAERERLADAHRQALRRLTALLMQMRDFDRALGYAHRAVEADPRNEAARHLLMRLYASIGRPAAVQAQLADWERILAAAGEPPPSPETRALALRLAEGTDKENGASLLPRATTPVSIKSSGKPAAAPVSVTSESAAPATHLPIPFTRFFGRSEEIAGIADLLSSGRARLVTLTGPGGTGKTRLALETADRLHREERFPGGIWFVPLADVTAPERLVDAVRDALHLSRTPSKNTLQQITEFLTTRTGACLLVLDNLEHLLGHGALDPKGAAHTAAALLARIPGLTLLATSRELLGAEGESEFPVPPLPIPNDLHESLEALNEYASVLLFVDRARARRVDFQITPRNAEAVARLCARLDGSPLAIELAAARAKLYTPAQMLDRLNEGFAVLESKRPDIAPRHRSLHAAAAWSVDLLSPAVRQLFAQLSVFRGGMTVEAAEAVCFIVSDAGQTVEGLTRLRDASLLVTETRSIGGSEEMRLRLLEPLREFAAELVPEGEREGLAQRHAAYYCDLAEEAMKTTIGPDQQAWFDRLEEDHDNIRAALTGFADTEIGLRMVGALPRFWMIRGHLVEGGLWLERTLAARRRSGDDLSPTLARAINAAGMLAYDRGDYEAARTFFQESRELQQAIGDRRGVAVAVSNLGNIAYRQGDYPTAHTLYAETLSVYREENYQWGIASSLGNLANVLQAEGDLAAARALQEESLTISREIGETRMTSYTLHNLGNLAQEEGDFSRAHALYAESLELKRSLGDRRGVASLLTSEGFLFLKEQDYPAACSRFMEAGPIARDVGATPDLFTALEGLAWLASVGEHPLFAVRLWAVTAATRETIPAPYNPEEQNAYPGLIAAVRERVGDRAFQAAWDEGRAMTLSDVLALALREMSCP